MYLRCKGNKRLNDEDNIDEDNIKFQVKILNQETKNTVIEADFFVKVRDKIYGKD